MKPNFSYANEKIHINMAILKKMGETFQIVIDPDLAIDFKNKKTKDIKEVLKSEHIFIDAHRGLRASETSIEKVLGTRDELEAAKKILEQGEIQLSQEYRNKLYDDKKKKILQLITTNAQDPKTGLPHPQTRIENALEEAKIKIDYYKSAEEQIDPIIQKIRAILPISMEKKHIHLKIPAQNAAKMYSVVTEYGKIMSEVYLDDGSWSVTIEMPAGLQGDFLDKINSKTHGDIEVRIVK